MAKRQLSEAAEAAKQIRGICKELGIKASVKSSNYSMGSSIRVKVNNLNPDLFNELHDRVSVYQYGHFDGMRDIYECSNKRDEIPQAKHVFLENGFSDELKQEAWSFLKKVINNDEIKSLSDSWDDVKKYSDKKVFDCQPSELVYRILRNNNIYGDISFWKSYQRQVNNVVPLEKIVFEIGEYKHTKKGFTMFIVQFKKTLEREKFKEVVKSAKNAGGWYSRKWGKTPSGFAFEDEVTAKEWAINEFKNIK